MHTIQRTAGEHSDRTYQEILANFPIDQRYWKWWKFLKSYCKLQPLKSSKSLRIIFERVPLWKEWRRAKSRPNWPGYLNSSNWDPVERPVWANIWTIIIGLRTIHHMPFDSQNPPVHEQRGIMETLDEFGVWASAAANSGNLPPAGRAAGSRSKDQLRRIHMRKWMRIRLKHRLFTATAHHRQISK